MKQHEKAIGKEIAMGAGIGAGGSMLATLALTALVSCLMDREAIGEASLDGAVVGILLVSSAVGSLVAASIVGHHRLPVCIAAGAVYYLALIGCNAMLFDGTYSAVAVTAIAVLGGSGAMALLGLNERRSGHRPHRTKRRNWKVVQN